MAQKFSKPLEPEPPAPSTPAPPVIQAPPIPNLVPFNDAVDSNSSDDEEPESREAPCWWYEHLPTRTTIITIRKPPHTSSNVTVVSDTSVVVTSTFSLAEDEFALIAHNTNVDFASIKHGFNVEQRPLVRRTQINLLVPIVDLPTVAVDNQQLIVVTFPMKKQQLLNFVSK